MIILFNTFSEKKTGKHKYTNMNFWMNKNIGKNNKYFITNKQNKNKYEVQFMNKKLFIKKIVNTNLTYLKIGIKND